MNALTLSTVVGLALARASGARIESGPDGLVLATGARGGLLRADAVTVGNVVVTTRTALDPQLLAHEARHATQWAWCVVLFLPLYAVAMAWSWVITGDRWSRNWFERDAGLVSGSYVESPTRWARRVERGQPE